MKNHEKTLKIIRNLLYMVKNSEDWSKFCKMDENLPEIWKKWAENHQKFAKNI